MKFKVSRRTDVALQALRAAAATEGSVPGSQLTADTDTSQAYLSQCLAPLISAGWLISRTGPEGGYAATELTREVTLLELIEAMEGPLESHQCALDRRVCGTDDPCALHPFWAQARQMFQNSLADVKAVQSLVTSD